MRTRHSLELALRAVVEAPAADRAARAVAAIVREGEATSEYRPADSWSRRGNSGAVKAPAWCRPAAPTLRVHVHHDVVYKRGQVRPERVVLLWYR